MVALVMFTLPLPLMTLHFPYTTLFRSHDRRVAGAAALVRDLRLQPAHGRHPSPRRAGGARRHPLVRPARGFPHRDPRPDEDRKSTRLNSSHMSISYAVFCFKKKNKDCL